MDYKHYRRVIIFRKAVYGLLILAVLVSLIAPQASVIASQRKETAITIKVDELLTDVGEYSVEDRRAQFLVKILKLLPDRLWTPLKTVKIEEKIRTPRGLKDKDSIGINYSDIDSDEEFIAVFLHELGHVVDLDVLVGKSLQKSSFNFLDGTNVPADDPSINFYKISWESSQTPLPETEYLDMVSEYGFTNPFEDFAEAFIFYLIHGGSFKMLSKGNEKLAEKYKFLRKEAFDGSEFSFGDFFYDNEKIYDTTVLFYDLEEFMAMMEHEKTKKQTISRMSSSRPPRYMKG